MTHPPRSDQGACQRIHRLRLAVTDAHWPFAAAHAERIAAHWRRRKAENPAFFNGRVFILRDITDAPERVDATLSLETFADFLYWRDHDYPDGGTLDGFGSALVRSAEGHALLGCHASGTLNAGSIYLPGGFLDARDARADGTIDLDASVARELSEETGLDAADLTRVPGYILCRYQRYCAFAVEYRSALPAEALRSAMLEGLARNAEQELADIAIVRDAADLERLPVLDHARFLLRHVLGGTI